MYIIRVNFICVFFFSFFFFSNAQEFRGGEIYFERIDPFNAKVFVDLYYKADSFFNAPAIPLDFSFGIESVQWSEKVFLTKGLILFRYATEHFFLTNDRPIVRIRTPFILEGLENIDTPFTFYLETVYNNLTYFGYTNLHLPYFHNLQDSYYFEDGVLYYQFESEDLDGNQIYFQYDWTLLNRFDTIANYTLPEASGFLYLDNFSGNFIWNKPVSPGKYLLGFEVLELLNGAFVIGSRQRYQIIEIKEEDIVLETEEKASEAHNLSLFPNPATHTLHLQLSSFQPAAATLTIQNAAGQLLRQEQLELSVQMRQHSVDVSSWPPGVYFLRVQAGGRQVVRRFVKTG